MNILYFTHSLRSDWNHGNAHFLRGVLTELAELGHTVTALEPQNSWSAENLRADAGPGALEAYREFYPSLKVTLYEPETEDWQPLLAEADLVIVHEWNPPALVWAVGQARARHSFKLLFHDTHHRAVTAPADMSRYDLQHYDGVLAFGQVIRQLYLKNAWSRRAWTWHEAADTRLFRPLPPSCLDLQADEACADLVWIGNWGDNERTREISEFLIQPAGRMRLRGKVHGVRYPPEAKQALKDSGLNYGGYLPNFLAPQVFARHRATVHIPRRPYVEALPGIPTIRPFEAMACGIPLVSAPWNDCEGLFRPDEDYLIARNGTEMEHKLTTLIHEPQLRSQVALSGLETVRARHTCAHRATELLQIVAELN